MLGFYGNWAILAWFAKTRRSELSDVLILRVGIGPNRGINCPMLGLPSLWGRLIWETRRVNSERRKPDRGECASDQRTRTVRANSAPSISRGRFEAGSDLLIEGRRGLIQRQSDALANRSVGGVRVDAAIILAGALRASPLASQTRIPVLDLPVCGDATVLESWLVRLTELAAFAPGGTLNVRVAYDEIGKRPSTPRVPEPLDVALVPEPKPFRGPAGAVLDVCPKMDDDGVVLILEGGRFASGSLLPLLLAHCQSGAMATVGRNSDKTPAGVYVVRREMMDFIPGMGFFDLKEQWLGKLMEEECDVRVHDLEQSGTYILRTREQFLRAMQVAAENHAAAGFGRFMGDTVATRHPKVVASGARVAEDAVILDSLVLDGAIVEARALVARSVICPGAVVKSGTTVVDAVVGVVAHGYQGRMSR